MKLFWCLYDFISLTSFCSSSTKFAFSFSNLIILFFKFSPFSSHNWGIFSKFCLSFWFSWRSSKLDFSSSSICSDFRREKLAQTLKSSRFSGVQKCGVLLTETPTCKYIFDFLGLADNCTLSIDLNSYWEFPTINLLFAFIIGFCLVIGIIVEVDWDECFRGFRSEDFQITQK